MLRLGLRYPSGESEPGGRLSDISYHNNEGNEFVLRTAPSHVPIPQIRMTRWPKKDKRGGKTVLGIMQP